VAYRWRDLRGFVCEFCALLHELFDVILQARYDAAHDVYGLRQLIQRFQYGRVVELLFVHIHVPAPLD